MTDLPVICIQSLCTDNSSISTHLEREHKLSDDAKKGLESVEDIDSASKSLRITEKDNRTGVGTEKTNPHDGVKEIMLFHVKGKVV